VNVQRNNKTGGQNMKEVFNMLRTKRFWAALILTVCLAFSLIPCGLVALADESSAPAVQLTPEIQGLMASGKTGAFLIANGTATPIKEGDVIAHGTVNPDGSVTIPTIHIEDIGDARTKGGSETFKVMPDGKVVVTEVTASSADNARSAMTAQATRSITYSMKSWGFVKDGSGNIKTRTQAGMIYLDSGTRVYSGVPNWGFTRNSPFVLVESYHPSDGTGPDVVGQTSRGVYRATIGGVTYQHDYITSVLATPGGYWAHGAEFSGSIPAGYSIGDGYSRTP
jgi:hypothetical protein